MNECSIYVRNRKACVSTDNANVACRKSLSLIGGCLMCTALVAASGTTRPVGNNASQPLLPRLGPRTTAARFSSRVFHAQAPLRSKTDNQTNKQMEGKEGKKDGRAGHRKRKSSRRRWMRGRGVSRFLIWAAYSVLCMEKRNSLPSTFLDVVFLTDKNASFPLLLPFPTPWHQP